MPEYRFYSLDGVGRIRAPSTVLVCEDDAHALRAAAAVAILNGQAEVWLGSRLVGRVESTMAR